MLFSVPVTENLFPYYLNYLTSVICLLCERMVRFTEKEPYSPVEYSYEVDRVLYKGKSKFQEILVLENPDFGRMLILDGIVQLTEKDEFFYHEMLTQVVMHSDPEPRRIVIIGGGDGGAVREVLKHESVEKLYFVELDEEVINVSKKYLPSLSCSIDDPRVEIKTMDGADFIKQTVEIDIVIVDSTDVIGFARTLFTKEFFISVSNALTDNGMFVTHTESMHFHKDIVVEMQYKIKDVFPVVDLYTTSIATYPGNWWAFAVGSKKLDPREVRRPFKIDTKYYDTEIHKQSFLTKDFYQRLLENRLQW